MMRTIGWPLFGLGAERAHDQAVGGLMQDKGQQDGNEHQADFKRANVALRRHSAQAAGDAEEDHSKNEQQEHTHGLQHDDAHGLVCHPPIEDFDIAVGERAGWMRSFRWVLHGSSALSLPETNSCLRL